MRCYLDWLITQEELNNNIEGIKILKDGPTITHLLFADDLILFGEATPNNAQAYARFLNTFTNWSGQKINLAKSSIRFNNNTQSENARIIRESLNYKVSPPKLKYLGLPLYLGTEKKMIFKEIQEKVQNKLQSWKYKLIS